ncbi:hypothetical protein [Amycolatopsis australiensis]|uniref:Uncharacterized protein n=1 Tax=Amycolatopsis australiensis TaxID=546364 RepID=A0A1K1QQS0_9PSEU|nr:hypothetical protein [Amycolatopsis australiensis]SFW62109.1 hypothetical protein SAMN04489730_2086 [Amycolatopsis australiensis]
MLIALSVLAVVSLLTTAAWLLTRDSPAETPRSLPSRWPTAGGEPIRPVPMPTGGMAAALPPPTRGHVLCTAVPEDT